MGINSEICTNELFKESETVEGLSKTVLKKLLSLVTKDPHFIFYGTLYKQFNGVSMSSSLGPTLANAFLVYHEKRNGLNVVHWNINHYTIKGTLMISLFYLIHQNILIVFIVT